jgi:preprotein translocase subunit SecF
MRLRLVPDETNIDFFKLRAPDLRRVGGGDGPVDRHLAGMGLNFGIDFLGGTTIRTEASQPVDVGAYRDALAPLEPGRRVDHGGLRPDLRRRPARGDDPHPGPGGQESVTPETVTRCRTRCRAVYPAMTFPSVESVGPKVSGELIQTAIIAVGASLGGDPDLHLAALRMAVLGGGGGRARP